jgi:hypothetical protein
LLASILAISCRVCLLKSRFEVEVAKENDIVCTNTHAKLTIYAIVCSQLEHNLLLPPTKRGYGTCYNWMDPLVKWIIGTISAIYRLGAEIFAIRLQQDLILMSLWH